MVKIPDVPDVDIKRIRVRSSHQTTSIEEYKPLYVANGYRSSGMLLFILSLLIGFVMAVAGFAGQGFALAFTGIAIMVIGFFVWRWLKGIAEVIDCLGRTAHNTEQMTKLMIRLINQK
jgi:hypothetical protein